MELFPWRRWKISRGRVLLNKVNSVSSSRGECDERYVHDWDSSRQAGWRHGGQASNGSKPPLLGIDKQNLGRTPRGWTAATLR